MMDVSVELHCERCGSANLSIPEPAPEEASLACNDCGAGLGTVADLKAELFAQALHQSAEALRRALAQTGD
ncbi:MAG: hypothetical protein ACT4N8_04655 [Sphingosinicella sp.]|uniref:hypothetical protein n=1 Tax=Sphingosinicella sp. TaxID=1917971 RepID=UPI004037DDBF